MKSRTLFGGLAFPGDLGAPIDLFGYDLLIGLDALQGGTDAKGLTLAASTIRRRNSTIAMSEAPRMSLLRSTMGPMPTHIAMS